MSLYEDSFVWGKFLMNAGPMDQGALQRQREHSRLFNKK